MNTAVQSCPASASCRRARRCMYAASLLQGMVFYGPIATLYRQARGISIFQISIIESVCLILAICLEIPWGIVADRIGYKRTLVICAFLGVLSKLIFWRADTFGMFLAERIVLAVVLAGTSGVDAAYLVTFIPEGQRHAVFGRYEALGTVGLLGASIVYSLFVKNRYELAGLLTVCSYACAAVFVAIAPKDIRASSAGFRLKLHAKERVASIGTITSSLKSFLPVLFATSLLAATNQTVGVFLVQLRYVQVGMMSRSIGIAYLLLTSSGIVGAWSSNRIASRTGGKRLLVGTAFMATASCLLMSSGTAGSIFVVVAVCGLRLSASMQVPLRMAIENRVVPYDSRASALSVFAVFRNIVEICVSLIFGAMAERDVRYALVAGALCCALSALLLLCVQHMDCKYDICCK